MKQPFLISIEVTPVEVAPSPACDGAGAMCDATADATADVGAQAIGDGTLLKRIGELLDLLRRFGILQK